MTNKTKNKKWLENKQNKTGRKKKQKEKESKEFAKKLTNDLSRELGKMMNSFRIGEKDEQ